MESRMLLGNSNNNNNIKQKRKRCYGEQQHQLLDIHRHVKIAPSSKRSKRAAAKRVVSIPIKGVESARGNNNNNKSGDGAPPADCWAWRKYGQKPIKGSPYPRGYYRCSSSKGCPARKQVERSHVDPTMLLITYSSDHNHSLPAPSRNQSTNDQKTAPILSNTTNSETKSTESAEADEQKQKVEDSASLLTMEDYFGWLSGLESAAPSFMMMDSSMFGDDFGTGGDSTLMPVMGEEDLSLFADLEELPECSAVFRRKTALEENMTCSNNATWFETTSL